MRITKDLVTELETIRKKNDGKLRPADALATAAKSGKKSTLYNMLDEKGLWNDTQAAEFGRLEFVRGIIVRIHVTVTGPTGNPQLVRAYVSPVEERQDGGGYVSVREVLDDDMKKRQLLSTALRELRSFKRKYRELQELFGIFEEIDEISEAMEEKAA